jgi:hypothetical protein
MKKTFRYKDRRNPAKGGAPVQQRCRQCSLYQRVKGGFFDTIRRAWNATKRSGVCSKKPGYIRRSGSCDDYIRKPD